MEIKSIEIFGEEIHVRCDGLVCRPSVKSLSNQGWTKGTAASNGYLRIIVKNKMILVHRIVAAAFLRLEISNKKAVVDHIDRVRENNRLENLRITDVRTNTSNNLRLSCGKITGVRLDARDGKWEARARIGGNTRTVGRFKNQDDAKRRYVEIVEQINAGKSEKEILQHFGIKTRAAKAFFAAKQASNPKGKTK